MIDYRRINIGDVESLVALAIEAIPKEPEVVMSPAKITNIVAHLAIHREHFNLAAFEDGKPVAGIAMWVSEMPFHLGCEGAVVFCYSKSPGAGYRLVREMIRWVFNDMRVRRVSWAMNRGYDQRIRKLALRCGFTGAHDVLVHYKG